MICPDCGREYREGITWCNNCETELVEKDEHNEVHASDEYVEVLSTYSQREITFLKSILERENITFYFDVDLFGHVDRLIQPAALMVIEKDLEQVYELLKDHDINFYDTFTNSGFTDYEE
ncbi:hypothetical protein ACFL6I_02630 [candidate division KSB1 bacterium]